MVSNSHNIIKFFLMMFYEIVYTYINSNLTYYLMYTTDYIYINFINYVINTNNCIYAFVFLLIIIIWQNVIKIACTVLGIGLAVYD